VKPVTDVRAVPHILGYGIDLKWRNPSGDSGEPPLAGLRILRRERTFPLDAQDGQQVYDGPAIMSFRDRGLLPLVTYYYTVFAYDNSSPRRYTADDRSRAAALSTADYNLVERLYNLLPAAHRRADLLGPAEREELARLSPGVLEELAALPAALRERGPLRRFFQAAAAPLNTMRSTAEGLRHLYDLNAAPPNFLLPLAHWIGWELDRTQPVSAQRNEIKFAPPLYRQTGAVPTLRALVTRYSGWDCRVAEFVQQLSRSNLPAQLNVFASVRRGAEWCGADDAALVLGFGAGNDESHGASPVPPQTVGTSARLVGSAAQPFALRPGTEFGISANGRLPARVRFQPGDFADITRAAAAEVAATLNRLLPDVVASEEVNTAGQRTGRLVLKSISTGAGSSLHVEKSTSSLLTLEGAPRGRLSPCADDTTGAPPRMRLFYETFDPLAPAIEREALRAIGGAAGGSSSKGATPGLDDDETYLPSRPLGRIRYKTFRNGVWGESYQIAETGEAQGDPAAVQLKTLTAAGERLLLAWIESPHTNSSRLRYAFGRTQTLSPAALVGQHGQPFKVTPGTYLVFRGSWPEAETFQFVEKDFASAPDSQGVTASAAQLAAILQSRLKRVVVEVTTNGALRFRTQVSGGDQRLALDLSLSTAAASLGFDAANAAAVGDWGDVIVWSAPGDVPGGAPGRHADLHALVDSNGVVWLFWSRHAGGMWRVVCARREGSTWLSGETLSKALVSGREPCAALDSQNRIVLVWSSQSPGAAPQDDTWILSRRIYTPATKIWDSEVNITTPPEELKRVTDREPGLALTSDGKLRLFFRSDCSGGKDLWHFPNTDANALPDVQTTPDATRPDPLLLGGAADQTPTPFVVAPDTLWLFFRSDRSISPSGLERRATAAVPPRSSLVEEVGTLRRYAGATSVVPSDESRIKRRRLWDDLLSYTPQAVGDDEVLTEKDYYTRGTVGLYLTQAVTDSPLSQQTAKRLLPVLEQFLPINVRAVVILAPRVDSEYIYDGTKVLPADTFRGDKYPAVEYYAGLRETALTLKLQGWEIIYSAVVPGTPKHVTVKLAPADTNTWKFRTYTPLLK
jgi:phage tail-like protein